MRRSTLILLAVFCVLSAASGLGEDKRPDPDQYLAPEVFLAGGRPAEYLPYAKKFLKDNPQDSRAPRIVLDMLMFSTAAQDQEGVKDAKLRLLLDHPQTLPAAYLVKTSQASDIRDLLKERFTNKNKPLDRDTLARFSITVRWCLGTFGASFGDEEITAQAFLAMQPHLSDDDKQQLARKGGDSSKTLLIALDTTLTSREKFIRLQELKEFKTARAWQTFLYFDELTPADKADLAVRTIIVENQLADKEFADALLILKDISKSSNDPKLLFWQGWSQAATGDAPEAMKTLAGLSKRHPQSPWAASASELHAALSFLASNLEEHAEAVEKLFAALQAHPLEVVELEIEWTPADAPKVQALAGLDLSRNQINLFIRKAGQPLLGYSAGKGGSKYFIDGDPNIHEFAGQGPSPAVRFNVTPSPNGYHFGFNVNMSTSPDSLQGGLESLLKSPAFATAEARKEFLLYQIKQGTFPAKIVAKDGEQRLRWLIPQVTDPKLQIMEVRLTAENKIVDVSWDKSVSVRNIRYGDRNDVQLSSPKWPDLVVTKATEMGAAEIFRLLGAVTQMLDTKKKAGKEKTETADKPMAPRR
jgi:hypothetical protein